MRGGEGGEMIEEREKSGEGKRGTEVKERKGGKE